MVKTPAPGYPEMLAEPRRTLRLAAFLLAGAVLLSVVVWVPSSRSVLQWGDDRFSRLMADLRVSPAVHVAKGFDVVGGPWCNWTLRMLVCAVLCWRRHWLHLVAFVLAVVTSEALIGIIKAMVDRPRPTGSLIATTGASFPSGHAVAAAVTAVGVVIALLPAGPTRWAWERRAALYVSLMAFSRVYLGAHWLSDVVAGAMLGSAIAIGWPAALVIWRGGASARRSTRWPPSAA